MNIGGENGQSDQNENENDENARSDQNENENDLIPNCLLLHLEAGRNLETFIASACGLKPFSSTE